MILNLLPTLLAVAAMCAVVSLILALLSFRCPKCNDAGYTYSDSGKERTWECGKCGFREVEEIQSGPLIQPSDPGPLWKSTTFWATVIGIVLLAIIVLVVVVPVLDSIDESGFNGTVMTL